MFTYRYDIYTCQKNLHGWSYYNACAGNIQPFRPKRTHSKHQKAKERASKKVFWKYSPNTKTTQALYAKTLYIRAQNRRKQILLLAHTFEEQNIQRQLRQGPVQLSTATHDHEKSRERQVCNLSCPYFAYFSSQSIKHKTNQVRPFVITHDRAKRCSHH